MYILLDFSFFFLVCIFTIKKEKRELMKNKKYLEIGLCMFFLVLQLYVLATLGYKNK